MKTTHILITRYNVRISSKNLNLEWLNHRESLFERFTLPSVENTIKPKNFKWIVLIDMDIPKEFLASLRKLTDEIDYFYPIYCNDNWLGNLQKFVNTIQTDKLVTTRLDSDDAIHKEYLVRVVASAEEKDSGYINYTHGVQYQKSIPYSACLGSNSFLSRVEDKGRFKTVLEHAHYKAKDDPKYFEYSTLEPMWLENAHSKAMTTRVINRRVSFGDSVVSKFGIKV